MSRQSEKIDELAKALVAAQKEIVPPKKTATAGTGGKFSYKYAPLDEVIAATKDVLSKHGLAITQMPLSFTHGTVLETKLIHVSGQWISGELPLPTNVKPQELGSALTYYRRYCLSSILGISAEDDDDGATASNTKSSHVTQAAVSHNKGTSVNNSQDPGKYVVSYGKKYWAKTLDSIPSQDLISYANFLEKAALEKKQALPSDAKDLISAIDLYVSQLNDSINNADIPEDNWPQDSTGV